MTCRYFSFSEHTLISQTKIYAGILVHIYNSNTQESCHEFKAGVDYILSSWLDWVIVKHISEKQNQPAKETIQMLSKYHLAYGSINICFLLYWANNSTLLFKEAFPEFKQLKEIIT